MTPEGRNVAYLVKRCRELRMDVRKVSWEGRRYAPDRLVMGEGASAFIECKAPGARPNAGQIREHIRMQRAGLQVFVCDCPEQIDQALYWVRETGRRAYEAQEKVLQAH